MFMVRVNRWGVGGLHPWPSFAYLGGLKVYCKCRPVLSGQRQGERERQEPEKKREKRKKKKKVQ